VPRYVILEHTGSKSYKTGRHWDLMLEADNRLRTWELEAVPSSSAVARGHLLSDHRLEYLDYEGPVSNNRGNVRRWDAGEYDVLTEEVGELSFQLSGQQLRGQLRLVLDKDHPGEWLVSFESL
jgi:DNA polymerase ligase (LigD)-like protein